MFWDGVSFGFGLTVWIGIVIAVWYLVTEMKEPRN